MSYLNPGLPSPTPTGDGLDGPYWEGLQREVLLLQRCNGCSGWQWGPEWSCHRCHSFDLRYEECSPAGMIYSYERVWHPVHPALKDQGPYLIVLVTLPEAGGVRLVGNLLGDPHQEVLIGHTVRGVFEHRSENGNEFTLLQWELEPAAG